MQQDRPLSEAEARAIADWYRAAGVDVAVGEEPVDRFAASVVKPRAQPAAAAGPTAGVRGLRRTARPRPPALGRPAVHQ